MERFTEGLKTKFRVFVKTEEKNQSFSHLAKENFDIYNCLSVKICFVKFNQLVSDQHIRYIPMRPGKPLNVNRV